MTKPSTFPIQIATNDNFASGTYAGQPTKVPVPSGVLENGFLPKNPPPVDIWNAILNDAGAWNRELLIRSLRFTAPSNGIGVGQAVIHDTEIEALHAASGAAMPSLFGKRIFVNTFDNFPASAADTAQPVSAAIDPNTGRILVGLMQNPASDANRLFESNDRESWTDVGVGNIPACDEVPPFIWWHPYEEQFLIIARDGATTDWNVYLYDGTTFTAHSVASFTSASNASYSAAFGGGIGPLIVLRGSGGPKKYVAGTWTFFAIDTFFACYDITFVPALGLFFACGFQSTNAPVGPALYSSPDGETWMRVAMTKPWPMSTISAGGMLSCVCERYGFLFGVFYSQDDFTVPTDGNCFIGFSRDGGVTWEMFDEVPDAIEKIQSAPGGLVLVPHQGAATTTFVSG